MGRGHWRGNGCDDVYGRLLKANRKTRRLERLFWLARYTNDDLCDELAKYEAEFGEIKEPNWEEVK